MTVLTTVAVHLGGFQQDGGAGGDWQAEAIGIAIGGFVVLIAAIALIIVMGRRPPRSDERSPDD